MSGFPHEKKTILPAGEQAEQASEIELQVHFFKTLCRIEQKWNAELEKQLSITLEDAMDVIGTCETMTTALISAKADYSLIAHEVEVKSRELNSLNLMLDSTTMDLFKCTSEVQQLQAEVYAEEQSNELLQEEINELMNEVRELGLENQKLERKCRKELKNRSKELITAKETLKKLKTQKKALVAEPDAAEQCIQTVELEREHAELLQKCENLQKKIDERLAARHAYYVDMFKWCKANALQLIISASIGLLPVISIDMLWSMLKY